jgi:hypothetical protein
MTFGLTQQNWETILIILISYVYILLFFNFSRGEGEELYFFPSFSSLREVMPSRIQLED